MRHARRNGGCGGGGLPGRETEASVALALPAWLVWPVHALGQTGWRQVVYSLVGIAVAAALGRLLATVLMRTLGRWARRTDAVVDDAVVLHLSRPIHWLLPIAAAAVTLPALPLPSSWHDSAAHAALVFAIVATGWSLVKLVYVAEHVVRHRFDVDVSDNLHARQVQTQFRALRNVATFLGALATAAAVLMTFDSVRQLGTGLLASAGVAGIVIGFAAQKSIATLLAGIQIALSQPIRVDDVVIVEGEWGRIEEIRLTYVVVRIWDERRLIVPVTQFIDKAFQNWTRVSSQILGTATLSLDYSIPVDEVRAELDRVLRASPKFDGRAWGLQVTDATERCMTLRALMSAKDASDAWDLRCEVREKLIGYVQRTHPDALPRVRGELYPAARAPHGVREATDSPKSTNVPT